MVTVKTGSKSFLDVVSELEQMKAAEVVLFLDFDRRGKEGTKRLKQCLERARIKPNIKFWAALSSLLGRDIQCVEGLTAYLATLRTKIGAISSLRQWLLKLYCASHAQFSAFQVR